MMKRIVFFLICLFLFSFILHAADIGFTIDNTSTANLSGTSSVSESIKGTFFLNASTGSAFIFNMKVGYSGSWTGSKEETLVAEHPVWPLFLDIDRISIGGTLIMADEPESTIKYQLGRFLAFDASGMVIAHKLDGFSFGYHNPLFTTNFTLGYTGFLWKNVSSVVLSNADISGIAITDTDSELYSPFGSPRGIGLFEIRVLDIFKQSLTLSWVFQEDLRQSVGEDGYLKEEGDDVLPGYGGILDTQYWGLHFTGPIIPTIYYRTGFIYGTGSVLSNIDSIYQWKPVNSFMMYAGTDLYLQQYMSSAISVKLAYASGDEDNTDYYDGNTEGDSTIFTPINSPGYGLVFTPALSNIWILEADYSLKPFEDSGNRMMENIQTMVKGFLFFRSTSGAVSDAQVPTGIDGERSYLGTELDFIVNYRPLSDLGVSFSTGFFIPNFGSDAIKGLIRLNFNISI